METYNVGWVYVIAHPEWNDRRVKIGMTNRTVEERARELNNNSMMPGNAYPAYAVLVHHPSDVERAVHKALRHERIDAKRELFQLSEAEAAAQIHDYCAKMSIKIMDQSGTERALMGVEPKRVKKRAEERKKLEIELKKEERAEKKREQQERESKEAERAALQKKRLDEISKKIEIRKIQKLKDEEESRQRLKEKELQRNRKNLLFDIDKITSDSIIKGGDKLRNKAAKLKNPKPESRFFLYAAAFFALVELYGAINGNAPELRGVLLIPAGIFGCFYLFLRLMDYPLKREEQSRQQRICQDVDQYNKTLSELELQHEKLVVELLEIDEYAKFSKLPQPIKFPVDYQRF